MTWRGAIALVLLALLASVFNLAVVWQRTEGRERSGTRGRLVPWSAREVLAFRLHWPDGGEVACRRSERGWWLEAPVRDRAARHAVDEILAFASFARRDEPLAAGDSGEAGPSLILETADNRLALGFGTASGPGGGAWVESEAFPGERFRVGRGLVAFLQRRPEAYRAQALFAGSPLQAERIELRWPAAPAAEALVAVLVRTGSRWSLRTPLDWPAAGAQVDQILRHCAELRLRGVLAEKTSEYQALGLGEAAASVSLVTAEAGMETVRLGPPLGGRSTEGVACVDGRTPVFRVSDALRKLLGRLSVDRLREHRFDPLAAVQGLSEILIQHDDEALRLKSMGRFWRGVSPATFDVESAQLEGLVRCIENLRAERFVTDDRQAPEAFGLDDPAVLVQMRDTEGHLCLELHVGEEAEEGRRYARLVGRPAVFTLPKETVLLLTQPWYTYHLRLICYFGLKDVKRLSLWREGQETRYQRTVGDAWQMALPKTVPADAMALYRGPLSKRGLGELRALAFVAAASGAEELSKFGLDHPQLRVLVESALPEALGSHKTVTWDLEIGSPTVFGKERSFYARFRDRPLVFLVKGSVVEMLLRDYTATR